MKLASIIESYTYLDDKHYYAYHVTNSFHIVKKIFSKGFRTPAGIDRVCFSDKPWDEMGLYIIKVIAKKDEHYDDGAESGACAHNVKPVAWGFIFSADNIHWINRHPKNVDLQDYDEMVRSEADQYHLYHWDKDLKAEDENDAILDSLLGRSWGYDTVEIDSDKSQEILNLLKNNSRVEAFKKSKVKLSEFRDYLAYLLDNDQYSWDMSPD